ncbi:MAG: septum formation initiator family protein [Oscillospiraceae bacterium]|nr:septum formation initiator family protein [Oscillospiraceae bacterium]
MSFKLRSQEARETRKKHGFVSILARIAVAIVSVAIVYIIINDQIQINEYNAQYEELLEKTNQTLEENAEISRYLDDDANLDEYIESIAREKLDFANPDERIYYIIPSSKN